MNKIQSQKIGANLALNKISIDRVDTDELKVRNVGKNVIFAIDVSGSMSWDLRLIRTQLKNKIPNLINPNDTISIIWFSGRNEAGILKEGVKVTNLQDLQKLNEAIDRFLQPIGLTAFLPPLKLTEQVINNLSSNGNDFSFIFLSDGYNNDSAWPDVIKKLSELESKIATSTFIEYGYYADSAALTEMAELIGGEKIFSKDFDQYEVEFSKIVSKETDEKVAFSISEIKDKLRFNFLFAFDANNDVINVYSTAGEREQVLIQSNVENLYFISRYKVDSVDTELNAQSKLVAAYLLADRLKYTAVEDILAHIGDPDLLNELAGAFGKQRLNELKSHIKDYAFVPNLLYAHGKIDSYKVNPNQFCLLDLLGLLQADGNNKFFPYHPDFKYNRISAKSTTKVELTDDTKEKLKNAKTLSEIEKIAEEVEAPEFIYPDNIKETGFDFMTLDWTKDRANISVKVKVDGKVKLPKNDFGLTEVDSYIFRNFSIVADGLVNVKEIPVELSEETAKELFKTTPAVITSYDFETRRGIIDISLIPVVNRSMTTNISGKKLAKLEYDLLKVQAAHKYIKELKKEYSPKENELSAAKYSKEAAAWLQEIGVTDYNGFSPKTEIVKSDDFYIAQVLETKISKLSSIPKTSDVFSKVETIEKAFVDSSVKAKQFTVSEELYKSQIDKIGRLSFSTFNYANSIGPRIDVINEEERKLNKERRELLAEIAKIKFGLILSRSWFTEFKSLEENTLSMKFDVSDTPLDVKFVFSEKQIFV